MELPFMKPRTIAISQSTIVFTVIFLISLYLLYQVRSILALFFLAFIMMVALNPIVKRFQRWGMRRSLAILLAYVLLILILGSFLGIILPPLITELSNLFAYLRTLPWLSEQFPFLNGEFSSLQNQLVGVQLSLNDLGNAIGALRTPFSVVFSIIGAVFSNFILIVSIFVMSYFLLSERPHLHTKLRWLTSDERQLKRAQEYLDTLEEQLGGWVRGELILMFIIGLATFIGLSLLNIPYALPLAILAGVLELVPNIGPTISAIPPILLAFSLHGPVSGLMVLIFSLMIQQIENNFLVPRVMRSSAQVGSLVVILIILAGVQLAGVMGALLAVPLYITFRSWYSFYIYPRVAK